MPHSTYAYSRSLVGMEVDPREPNAFSVPTAGLEHYEEELGPTRRHPGGCFLPLAKLRQLGIIDSRHNSRSAWNPLALA
ncbi:hypothetical protein FHL15_003123 [Xylaria flabelliformis]|uniref:Uncharacterized protein n=1 Tax=Xylaria flabelliformis TaxID=2512241 RepID=A0A553I702_9PEZI|nr:hypothetical protein FHL15_003123 [Xylaria flabelliformis]